MRNKNFLSFEPKPFTFKQEKKIITLKYKRHNESYEVIKNKVQSLGYKKGFKDFIYENLNPIVSDEKTQKFGIQPKLKGINQVVFETREKIDNAYKAKQELEQHIKELERQTKAQEQPQAQEKGEPTND